MLFRNVIGQEQIKEELRLQVQEGHVPHAQLFYGPEGSGKFAMALAYASYLLCSNPSAQDSCCHCKNCVMTQVLGHPDLHFVFPVINKKKTQAGAISDNFIKEWRSMLHDSLYFSLDHWMQYMEGGNQQPQIYVSESESLLRKLSLMSSQGGRKVVIIWLPERMLPAVSNKLLKVLEEPPAGTVFLLISNEPDLLLDTILSRTQRVQFPPLAQVDIETALQEAKGLSPEDAQRVARYANGNYIKALESLQVNLDGDMFFENFVSLMRLAYMRKIKDLYEWSEQADGWGRERQKNFFYFCQRLVRENFISNFNRPELNFMSVKESDFSKNFARFINERNVIGMTNEIDRAIRDIEHNVNSRMVFFDFALKMIVLLLK